MHRSLLVPSYALALLGSSGCYAAAGPTIGYDLHSQRLTLGAEASGTTFTIAHEWAIGRGVVERNTPPTPKIRPLWPRSTWERPERPSMPVEPVGPWRSRTFGLWEPGYH